jgi:voltage-gated potassium channel
MTSPPSPRQPASLEPAVPPESAAAPWRHRLHTIIFEADTRAGRAFDIALIVAIVLSVIVVVAESVQGAASPMSTALHAAEWILTVLFTAEYIARLIAVRRPLAYATSFFGIVDLLAIVPAYAGIFFGGGRYFLVVRALRLLRIFRIFKLAHFLDQANVLTAALRASRVKIAVFLFTVLTLVVIIGALMYVIEGPEHGFTSIPIGMYWAVVTLTTVGYGDVAPATNLGRFVASFVMILGYGIIAVPTGIVTTELVNAARRPEEISGQSCPSCGVEGHRAGAKFCYACASAL